MFSLRAVLMAGLRLNSALSYRLTFAPFLSPLRTTRLPPLTGAAASVASIGRAREKRPVTPAATRSVR